jgi:hypothetical protein
MPSRFSSFVFGKMFKYYLYLTFICIVVILLVPILPKSIISIIGWSLDIDISSYLQFYKGLVPNLVSAAIIFVVGLSWTGLRKWLLNSRARFFWGRGLFDGSFVISHGTLSDKRRTDNQFNFLKTYRDGRTLRIAGPSGDVLGDCEVRSISYLLATLSKYRQQPVAIESDVVAYPKLSRSIVSLGSPASNEVTEIILSEPNNRFVAFDQDESGPFIYVMRQDLKARAFQGSPKKDMGLVLKIRNERFPGHYFFVCAGLGEWGTSGAAWFLAMRWRELDDLGEEFVRIVEVEIGSDESARPVRIVEKARTTLPTMRTYEEE